MIESIRLQNHEAHKAFHAPLLPGLNVIVGKTDSGKSSILRALAWVARHESLGSRITHGESTLRVGIKTELGSVVRFRSSEGYGYKAGGQTFLACAQNQPKEVADILQLSDINIQLQHDAPFLLGLTPGKLAEAINSVVDLSSIDKCSTWLKSQRTKTNALLESAENKKKALSDQVAELFWVGAAQEAYQTIKLESTKLKLFEARIGSLTVYTTEMKANRNYLAELSPLQKSLQDYETQASITQGGLHRTKARKQGLRSVVDALGECSRLPELGAIQGVLVGLVSLDARLGKALKDYTSLFSLVSGLQGIPEKISKLYRPETIIKCIVEAQANAESLNQRHKTLKTLVSGTKEIQNEIPNLIQEKESIEQKMGVCSECGKPL